jgi:hypothetical protein
MSDISNEIAFYINSDDKMRTSLAELIENINLNPLSNLYTKDNSLFKRRLDKLNMKFYIETENYLNNKQDMENCQKQLFIILFKQISLYIEEIERLNTIISDKNFNEKSVKERLEEVYNYKKDR